ncbi:hypothetical protein Vadar_023419 [Vaccinium darrowii]|uniref:Uncharacterized protein n=1 Tax=Vaccinium darrowii TaxID=229202 RepID=A0ACB7ZMB9_9ERIC|nr:hypothetical protein Vadar_023419 [Vaccinium darrowii]
MEGLSSDESKHFLSDNELDDDFFPMAPVNAPIDWDVENAWNAMHSEPFVPPPPAPPVEEEEEEDPESEVEDAASPPQPPQPIRGLPAWVQWRGHNSNLDPNTSVYLNIEPLYPCAWKLRARPYYLGPVQTLSPCRNGTYRIAVPPGFALHYSEFFFHTQVSTHRPKDPSSIISLDLDFDDHRTYTEEPANVRHYPEEEEEGPWVRVTWKCYGIYEDTLEPEARMRLNYPDFFD